MHPQGPLQVFHQQIFAHNPWRPLKSVQLVYKCILFTIKGIFSDLIRPARVLQLFILKIQFFGIYL